MMQGLLTARPQYLVHYCRSFTLFSFFLIRIRAIVLFCIRFYLGGARGEIYEPFMRLKSQVELTPPRPSSWAGSEEDLIDSTPRSSKTPPLEYTRLTR